MDSPSLVERLTHPWACLDKKCRSNAQRVVEICKHVMRTEFESAIRRATGPIIQSIFADAKPLAMRCRKVFQIGDVRFSREGGAPKKLLGIRQLLQSQAADGRWQCAKFFRDHFPLSSETHWQLLECIKANGTSHLCELRPQSGVNITSLHVDGGVFLSLAKKTECFIGCGNTTSLCEYESER